MPQHLPRRLAGNESNPNALGVKVGLLDLAGMAYSTSTMMGNKSSQNHEIALDRLKLGQCAVVRRVESDGEEVQRLKMLGLCVGRRVELIRVGDPLIIRIFSSKIGISASLASQVWLELCLPGHCALHPASEP